MVLGNSYGANMGELFYEIFGSYAKNMSKFTRSCKFNDNLQK